MKIKANDTSEYVYCFTQGHPQTLVILQRPEKIPQLTFNIGEETMFIWVVEGAPTCIYQTIKQTQTQLGTFIFIKNNLMQLEKDIKQKRTSSNLVVVHSPEIYDKISLLKEKISEIRKLICFSTDKYYHSQKEIDSLIRDDRNTLVKWMHYFKGNSYCQKLLPNFLFINSDSSNEAETSNLLMKTIYAMSNFRLDKQTNGKVIDYLEKVVLTMEQVNKSFKNSKLLTKQFFDDLRNNMDEKSSIKWYTRQSIVNKLTNNLLRSGRKSTQIFYLLPYFSKLFHAIQRLFRGSPQQNNGFKCYRGGKITEEEIQSFKMNRNSKKIVQNLGFLSTSKSYEVADSFSENVIFQIQVEGGQKCNSSHCYAEISKFSQYFSESEIIFNPLNMFQVMQVSETDDQQHKYKVCLKYKSFRQQQKLSATECEEQQQFEIYKNWDKGIKQLSTSQEATFAKRGQILPEFYCYWQKYMQIVQQQLVKSPGSQRLNIAKASGMIKYLRYAFQTEKLINVQTGIEDSLKILQSTGLTHHPLYLQCTQILGQAYFVNSQYRKATQLFECCLQNYKRYYGQKSKQYYAGLNNLGTIYNASGRYQEALEIFKKWECTSIEIFPINSAEFISNQVNLAVVLSNQGYRGKAMDTYLKYLQLFKKSKGQGDPNYLYILKYLSRQYFEQGKLDKALQFQNRLVSIMHENKQEHSLFCLQALGDLAQTYSALGKLYKSSQTLKYVILKLKELCGKQHTAIAEAACKLGKTLKNLRRYSEAFFLFKTSLNQTSKLLGFSHIKCAIVLNELALLFKQKGKFTKAIKFFLIARNVLKKQKGEINLRGLSILHNIGTIYLELQYMDTALAIFQKVIKLIENMNRKQNNLYSICLSNIALIFRQRGDVQNSILLFKKSLYNLLKLNNRRDMTLFLVLNRLAYAYILAGKLRQSIQTSTQCIILILGQEGHYQNSEYLEAITNLANAYQRKGMLAKAIQIYQKCLVLNRKFSERDDTYLSSLLNNMGCAYKQKGQIFLALKHFEISYKIGRKIYSGSNEILMKYLENYALCLLELGKFTQCSRLYEQFLKRFGKLQLINQREKYLSVLHKLALVNIEKGDLGKCAMILKKSKQLIQDYQGLGAGKDLRKIENFFNKNYLQLKLKSRMRQKIESRIRQLRESLSSCSFSPLSFQIWVLNGRKALDEVGKMKQKLGYYEYCINGSPKLRRSLMMGSKGKQSDKIRSKLELIRRRRQQSDRACLLSV